MRARSIRVMLLTAMSIAAAVGSVAHPMAARADYPAGGTYTCQAVSSRDHQVVAGSKCVRSDGAPGQGPVDKFYIQSTYFSGLRWLCSTGIAAVGIIGATDDVIGNGCAIRVGGTG